MPRSVMTLLLAVAAFAATAQTAPRPASKTTVRKPAARPKTDAMATPAPAPAATDTASAARSGGFGNAAAGSSANTDGQGVYAAPGMPVNVSSGKKVGSYKGAAEKTAPKPVGNGTTLSPK